MTSLPEGESSESSTAFRSPTIQRRRTEQDTPISPRFRNTRVNTRSTLDGEPRNTFSLRRAATTMLQPEKPVGPPPSVWISLRSILFHSWINILLVFIPVSWALHFALPEQQTLIFVCSFLAIVPLAKLLAFATDELSMRVGQTLAGLLNATLGNAVELIVAIIALTKCELSIVQSSLVGSILSNLLLVLGMCFFAGGLRFSEQGFGLSAVQLNSSLLTISVIAVLLPGAFHLALSTSNSTTSNSTTTATNITTAATNTTIAASEAQINADILKTSHGVAIILLFIYASYLVFQLFSHKDLYDDKHIKPSTAYDKNPFKISRRLKGVETLPSDSQLESGANANSEEEQEGVETPQMSVLVTTILLASVTVLVAVTAEWLVDSINGLTATGHISKEFVGVILLPIVGNAAEHVTAVTVSVKDKLTLSLGVAVGSSIQIALFVIPFIVTLAWIMGKPLTLLFDPFESIVLFLSVLTVNYVVQDGRSNWLEGMVLMCLYLILAVTFWFYPGTPPIYPNC